MSLIMACPWCTKKRIPNFLDHVKKEHPEQLDRRGNIKCPWCKDGGYHYTNILTHVRARHPQLFIPVAKVSWTEIEYYTSALKKSHDRIDELDAENEKLRKKLKKIWHVMHDPEKE